MRIVVVTGKQLHHKSLCVRMAEVGDLVGVIHPVQRRGASRWKRFRAKQRDQGAFYLLLRRLARGPGFISGWRSDPEKKECSERLAGDVLSRYGALDPETIHESVDVKAESSADLLRELRPDVVVVMGGPIYPPSFIGAAPLMLNYHSGISPIYNGAGTINFAFANGHPHLCGGTLMRMDPVVDGGDILAHYLPAIEDDDTPDTLFNKTVAGGETLYRRFIERRAPQLDYPSVPQPKPLFYCLSKHWTVYQTRMIKSYLDSRLASRRNREERIVEYWAQDSEQGARRLFDDTISGLMWRQA